MKNGKRRNRSKSDQKGRSERRSPATREKTATTSRGEGSSPARRRTAAARKTRTTTAPAGQQAGRRAESGGLRPWHVIVGLAAALFVVFEIYHSAIEAPFLFDDKYLPFTHPVYKDLPLVRWIIGVRPTLMLSYWVNYQISSENPYSYHVLNVLLHYLNAILVFLIVRKLLERVSAIPWKKELIGAFAGGVFLLHPVQTEAVAYVASRSESLSVLFCYAAFTVFLYRRASSISLGRSLAVLALFGLAVTTKEHTITLPVLLLLTDYFFNPGFSFQGIKRNWRLYGPIIVAGLLGFVFILKKLSESDTAGFQLKGLPWYVYLVTQGKVIWLYLRLFLLPFGQNVDHNYPMAESVADPLGLLGLAALAAVVVIVWVGRRKIPLVAYGICVFLLLLAPTSSVVPIDDAFVERRLYLPMIGLLLAAAGLLQLWRTTRKTMATALAAVLVVTTFLGYQRAQVWAGPLPLWQDSVAKKPSNWRANFQLAYSYFDVQRCSEAVEQYEKTAALKEPDYRLLVDWALAYDCTGNHAEALAKLRQAAALEDTAHVQALIGMMYAKLGRNREALAALDAAQKLNRRFAVTYYYRGNIYTSTGDYARAAEQYRLAIRYNPSIEAAHRALQRTEQALRQQRQP